MAVAAISVHRTRSLLTMLDIIIGIASVVLVVLKTGSQERVLENIPSLGTGTITVRAGSGFGARDADRAETLLLSDASAIALQHYAARVPGHVRQCYGAASASAQINLSVRSDRR
ncbi:hypothetical protein [Roseinatronobacter sp.]|uniref:hypothetical protein n=1 Tax=Roseinatronobacter sp. TaxID=1945755 RepID=UPI003F7056A0